MANSVDPDQTAPIGTVCSGSTLFASILNSFGNCRQLFAADDFSRRHFQMHFFSWRLKDFNNNNSLYFQRVAHLEIFSRILLQLRSYTKIKLSQNHSAVY